MKRIPPSAAGLVAAALAFLFGYQGYVAFNDSTAAAYPAWLLVHRGTLNVPQTPQTLFWVREEFVNTGHGIYSNRPLGMILASVPGQLFPTSFSVWATNVLGAVVAGIVVFLFARLVNGSPLVTALGTLGTPLLYVGGRTLWPNTVDLACLLGVLLLAGSTRFRTGPAWTVGAFVLVAFATMCRPPLGLLIVLIVAAETWSRRSGWSRNLLQQGPAVAGFVAGGCALAVYAHHYFGTYSPAGAYPVSHQVLVDSILLGVFSPARGLLFYSPWLLFVRPPDRRAWTVLVMAIVYTIGVWMTYDAWGGSGFIGYRYGMGFAVIAAPWVRITTWPAKAAAAWSVAIGLVALTVGREPVSMARIWTHTGFAWEVLVYAAVVAALLLAGTWWFERRARPQRPVVDRPATFNRSAGLPIEA